MLQAQSLTCRRGKRIVFRDLDFTLNKGEALVVTGANGSGKSSLLRALAGLLPLAGGKVLWNGIDIGEDSDDYISQSAYLGHLDAVKPELTVSETLAYWGALYCCAGELVHDPFGVLAHSDRQVRYLSAGQKRRLALSRLFLRPTMVWLLDEPTTTLDNEGQAILTESIAKQRAKGGMVVIATHHEVQIPGSAQYIMKGSKLS